METKADGEVQSKDLAFAAVASTDDCSNCCCIHRMTDYIPPASSFAEINKAWLKCVASAVCGISSTSP